METSEEERIFYARTEVELREALEGKSPQTDVNWRHSKHDGLTALIKYCEYNDNISMIRILLERDDIDVNATDNQMNTALIYSCEKDRRDVVELLLKHPKIDINVTNRYDYSAFTLSVWYNHLRITEMILASDKEIILEEHNQINDSLIKMMDTYEECHYFRDFIRNPVEVRRRCRTLVHGMRMSSTVYCFLKLLEMKIFEIKK